MANQVLSQPSGSQQDLPMAAENQRQGDVVFQDTANSVLVLATDVTANRKAAGYILGYDRDNSGGAAGDKSQRFDSGGGILARPLLSTQGSAGDVDLTGGAAGTLDTITADGVEILSGAVPFDTDLATTAQNAVNQINANGNAFFAWLSGGENINIRERVVTKTAVVLVSTATTITTTDVNVSGAVVPDDSLIGADAFPVDEKSVKFAGNAKFATFERFRDQDGNITFGSAGEGFVQIDDSQGSITQISVGGTNLLLAAVAWTTSNENTAILVAAAINLNINTSKYFAIAEGALVKIFQTSDSINETLEAVVVTGTTNTITQDVKGGLANRCLVKLKALGTVLT
ncbi:MAG: hypothetical protein BMS9Abin32_160 [Gammaproteobacteria bacterium]|nr:MAG: hypothetical protein BMS9Abin32_160 [Gammaproteobacteria bacterium]